MAIFSITTLPAFGEPVITDQDLIVEKFVSGLSGPTTMAFVGDDILVLQKNDGKVRLIRDGILHETPVLNVSVNSVSERGLLGITIANSVIYLFFTESSRDGEEPLGNRIYSYSWDGQTLVNPVLVKDLPATPGPNHDGGAMVTGLDGTVYAVIGDLNRNGMLQNYPTGDADDTGVILRVVPEGPYYAMGVRNSFGLAVDPVNGNLWATENGPRDFDEINFVPPNFNSGWEIIMGPATESELASLPGYDGYVYSDPEFSWEQAVAPTAISFINSKEFGKYKNSIFVGDCNFGNLYKFELNSNRDGFVFTDSALADRVLNRGETAEEIVFGTGFGCITDIEIGSEGFLYVVSLSDGAIYRIMPKTLLTGEADFEEPSASNSYVIYFIIVALIAAALVYLQIARRKNRAIKNQ